MRVFLGAERLHGYSCNRNRFGAICEWTVFIWWFQNILLSLHLNN